MTMDSLTNNTEPAVQQPPKLQKVYHYLRKRNLVPEDTYERFEKNMTDPAKAEKVYNHLKETGKLKSNSFDDFQVSMGLKKKELAGAPISDGSSTSSQESFNDQLDKEQSLNELSDQWKSIEQQRLPLAQEQAKAFENLASIDASKIGEQPTPEKTRQDFQVQQQEKTGAENIVQEIDKQQRPELFKEKNPIITGGKSLWNVLSNQLPSAIAATIAAVTPKYPVTGGAPLPLNTEQLEDYKKSQDETRASLLQWADERQQKGAKFTGDLVKSIDQVDNPIDALNYVFNAAGQATGQIPVSVATGGTSSIMQEVGSIYLESVKKIAAEKGISVDKVIDQDLDKPAYALTYGVAAGLLDRFGAGKVMKSFGKEAFKKALRDHGKQIIQSGVTESSTEYVQTWLEQIGAEHGSGKSFTIALEKAATDDANRKERIEGFVQGLIGGTALSGAGQLTPKFKDNAKIQPHADVPPVKENSGVGSGLHNPPTTVQQEGLKTDGGKIEPIAQTKEGDRGDEAIISKKVADEKAKPTPVKSPKKSAPVPKAQKKESPKEKVADEPKAQVVQESKSEPSKKVTPELKLFSENESVKSLYKTAKERVGGLAPMKDMLDLSQKVSSHFQKDKLDLSDFAVAVSLLNKNAAWERDNISPQNLHSTINDKGFNTNFEMQQELGLSTPALDKYKNLHNRVKDIQDSGKFYLSGSALEGHTDPLDVLDKDDSKSGDVALRRINDILDVYDKIKDDPTANDLGKVKDLYLLRGAASFLDGEVQATISYSDKAERPDLTNEQIEKAIGTAEEDVKKYREESTLKKNKKNKISTEATEKYIAEMQGVITNYKNKLNAPKGKAKSPDVPAATETTSERPLEREEQKPKTTFDLKEGDIIEVEYNGKKELLPIRRIKKDSKTWEGKTEDRSKFYILPPDREDSPGAEVEFSVDEIKIPGDTKTTEKYSQKESENIRTPEQIKSILKSTIPSDKHGAKVEIKTLDASGKQKTKTVEAHPTQIMMKKQYKALEKIINCLNSK